MSRSKKNCRKIPITDGVFIAIDSDGNVVNGSSNGPKLYVHKSVARRQAGPDGRVIMVKADDAGVVYMKVFYEP